MRIIQAIVLAGLSATFLAGCEGMFWSGQDKAPATADASAPSTEPATAATTDWRDANAESQYTILLAEFGGPRHARLAEQNLQNVKEHTRWDRDLWVLHRESASVLCRGRYRSINALQTDLKECKQFATPSGVRPFVRSHMIVLPGADIGPKKWNLRHVDHGTYTFQLGVFYNIPEQNYMNRKAEALDFCQKLRQRGYEAYFYHGPNRSLVTLGLYPASAVETRRIRNVHPQTKDVSWVEQKVLVNEELKKLREEFPELIVCGNVEYNITYNPATMKREKHASQTAVIPLPTLDDPGL